MQFSAEQRHVIVGMIAGFICALVALTLGLTGYGLRAMPAELSDRLRMFAATGLLVSLPLFVAIARLAKHRFFTPADIGGDGLSQGTESARVLQAVLQNTLEQSFLAVLAYFAWAIFAPITFGTLPILASIMFIIGRILFFLGYKKGAGSRAFGFTLTFYLTVGMLVCMLPLAVLYLLTLR
jgi:hypothetical protein